MSADISRHLLDTRLRYATALAQQGRAFVESEWNEMVLLEDHDRRQVVAETVCTAGSPNDGFKIGVPSPPAPTPTFPDAGGPLNVATYDFPIGRGSFYLGGYRFTAESDDVFLAQPDWLTATLGTGKLPSAPTVANLAGGTRTDIVYLHAWQQSVTSIEDEEFRERALGGPDTGVRVRRMRRVEVLENATATNCAQARQELRDVLTAPHSGDNSGVAHDFDPAGTELQSKARLTVSFVGGTDTDPCKPRQVRGFIGAENQAIRVQLTAANAFVWGIDNASPVYRVQVDPNDPSRTTIKFVTLPRDRASMPQHDQAIEILPWGAFLANGEKAAAPRGFLSAIASSYDPADGTLTITTAVPQGMVDWLAALPPAMLSPLDPPVENRFFYARIWSAGAERTFVPDTPVDLPGTGFEITFSDFGIPGDYWVIAARPNTPDLVVPWRLLDHAPPTGPQELFTVLALVTWRDVGGTVTATVVDCRERFRSLCRSNGCCRVIVGDGKTSHGDFTSIQAAIDSLPLEGGEVCVLEGRYVEPAGVGVTIDHRTDVTVHGCGPNTVIVASEGVDAALTIRDSARIVIRDLAIEAPAARGVFATDGTAVTLRSLEIRARDLAAIVARVDDLVVEGCRLVADVLGEAGVQGSTTGLEPLLFAAGEQILIDRNRLEAVLGRSARRRAAGGLQIGGGSSRVEVHRNVIVGGTGNGITLGSIRYVTDGDDDARDSHIAVTGIAFDDDDCPQNPGDPLIPHDPEHPVTPESDGDLDDVRIEENRIEHMGRNGIAAFWLLFPDQALDMVTVRGLWILENVITDCMLLEASELTLADAWRVAFGGIVLADVETAVLRANVIENVGTQHRDPICGIYVLQALGIVIEENRLRNNGVMSNGDQLLKVGNRGGIVIRFAVPPFQVFSSVAELPPSIVARQDGHPAAVVHGNVVVAREGRALSIGAVGPVAISDNQLTTQGSDFLTLLPARLAGAGGSVGGGAASSATGLLGTVGTLPLLLDALGGTAVLVFDLGWSNEIYLQVLGASSRAFATGSDVVQPEIQWFLNGNVLFNDNQVVLDAMAPTFTLSLCAILLLSFDSVTMANNQVDCDLLNDFVIVDTFVFTLAAQVTGNRFKEGYFNAYLSALTVGFLMNATGLNVGTHCILDRGLLRPMAEVSGGGIVRLHLNVALQDRLTDGLCRRLDLSLGQSSTTWNNLAAVIGP